jgi:hypothetical protein
MASTSEQPDQGAQPPPPASPPQPPVTSDSSDRVRSFSNLNWWQRANHAIKWAFAAVTSGECGRVFPPKSKWRELMLLWISWAVGIVILLLLPSSISLTYVALGSLPVVLLVDRVLRWEVLVHRKRLVDFSQVRALLVSASTVKPRLPVPVKPDNYEQKRQELLEESSRLTTLGQYGWTEYQVLPLDQMLVDFLQEGDLRARALLSLAELEDYAVSSSYRYDRQHYDQWGARINRDIEGIDEVQVLNEADGDAPLKRDTAAEPLRADLRSLLEHIADYSANWAEGSVRLRSGLMLCGVAALAVFLAMGLLPLFHPAGRGRLDLLNWGFLGISGSLAAVLLELRKSDLVEVGNTDSYKEMWRAVLGAALGLLAGVLIYSTISGELLKGNAVPKVDSDSLADIGLSILWSVASGFSFERAFDRMRSATESEA